MMEVLLLLCACFCVGLSYNELEYGRSFTMRLLRKAQSLTFTPGYDESNATILWKRDDPPASQDSRWKVTGSYYVINLLTQEDSGTYILRDKDRLALSVRTIRVVGLERSFQNTAGESFNFAFDLEPTSCHIYFLPESDGVEHQIVRHGRLRPNPECSGFDMSGGCGVSNTNPQTSCSGRYEVRDSKGNRALVATVEVKALEMSFQNAAGESFNFAFDLEPTSCHIYFFPETDRVEHQIVRHGRLQPNPECSGFEMSGRCGVSNSNPQTSCSGRYEVRDSKGNRALVATVEVEASPYDTKEIGRGIGIFCAVVGCCGFLKRCCCGKSSSKEEQPETPDEGPAVHYHDFDHEPVGPRLEQPYPAQPSHTPTGPLINNPPTTVPPAYSEINNPPTTVPPAYSEVFPAPAEPTVAPTVPVELDGEPRFELKGTSFSSAPPLGSDSPYGDVYTSDKLNFL